MIHTLEITDQELDALIDALQKGASRHEAFTRFNPQGKNAKKHEDLASTMRRLHRRFSK